MKCHTGALCSISLETKGLEVKTECRTTVHGGGGRVFIPVISGVVVIGGTRYWQHRLSYSDWATCIFNIYSADHHSVWQLGTHKTNDNELDAHIFSLVLLVLRAILVVISTSECPHTHHKLAKLPTNYTLTLPRRTQLAQGTNISLSENVKSHHQMSWSQMAQRCVTLK